MNCYATLADVKADLAITGTTEDAVLLAYLEGCSRVIDRFCKRTFYTRSETRYQTPGRSHALLFDDDLLSLSSFGMDSEDDGTWDGETWVENTDFSLEPRNAWPKHSAVVTHWGNYGFSMRRDYAKAIGVWGYGDGLSASPWLATAVTVTASTAGATSASVSAEGTIKTGQTILVESEQMFVEAASADGSKTLTVRRGVNGTVAASHTGKAPSVAQYPSDVSRFCSWLTVTDYRQRKNAGFSQERIGDYFYTRATNDVPDSMLRILGPFVREVA